VKCSKCNKRDPAPGRSMCARCLRSHARSEDRRRRRMTGTVGTVTCLVCGKLIVGLASIVVSSRACGSRCGGLLCSKTKQAQSVKSACGACGAVCPRAGLKFCSRRCWRARKIPRRPQVETTCAVCGVRILDQRKNRVVCSDRCRGIKRRKLVTVAGMEMTLHEIAEMTGSTVATIRNTIGQGRSPLVRARALSTHSNHLD